MSNLVVIGLDDEYKALEMRAALAKMKTLPNPLTWPTRSPRSCVICRTSSGRKPHATTCYPRPWGQIFA